MSTSLNCVLIQKKKYNSNNNCLGLNISVCFSEKLCGRDLFSIQSSVCISYVEQGRSLKLLSNFITSVLMRAEGCHHLTGLSCVSAQGMCACSYSILLKSR